MNALSPSTLLDLVARRADLIRCLRDGTFDKRDLEAELGVSRSTVNRGLRELEERALIRTHPGRYEVTPLCEFAYQTYQQLMQTYEKITDAEPLLPDLPADVPLELVEDADVSVAERPAPNQPADRLERLVSSADRIEGLAVVVYPEYVEVLSAFVLDEAVAVDIVVDVETLEHLWAEYPDELRAALDAENTTIQQREMDLPYGLLVVDGAIACLCVYDERGYLVGTLTNDTDAAVAWALEVFRRYRESADGVFLRGSAGSAVPVCQ